MMKKLNNKKGFTLAELLVVVAIIAVLVAISIPVFTSQLEKAREATDEANLRAAYAEVVTDALTGDGTKSITVTVTQKQENWQTSSDAKKIKIGDGVSGDGIEVEAKTSGSWTVGYDKDTNKVTIS